MNSNIIEGDDAMGKKPSSSTLEALAKSTKLKVDTVAILYDLINNDRELKKLRSPITSYQKNADSWGLAAFRSDAIYGFNALDIAMGRAFEKGKLTPDVIFNSTVFKKLKFLNPNIYSVGQTPKGNWVIDDTKEYIKLFCKKMNAAKVSEGKEMKELNHINELKEIIRKELSTMMKEGPDGNSKSIDLLDLAKMKNPKEASWLAEKSWPKITLNGDVNVHDFFVKKLRPVAYKYLEKEADKLWDNNRTETYLGYVPSKSFFVVGFDVWLSDDDKYNNVKNVVLFTSKGKVYQTFEAGKRDETAIMFYPSAYKAVKKKFPDLIDLWS